MVPRDGALAAQGYSFLFVAEVGPTTCERCLANNGKVYPFEEVVGRELNPPLHFHCRCTLVPVKPGEGGAGEAPEDNQSLEGSGKPWYAPILPLLPYLKNLAGVPGEFWEMVRGFQQAQQKRWEERQILDLASLGLVSGFWEGMEGRAQTVLESPSIYNVANWLSMGLLDLGKGAINPEKPLSLEHWLDSLGFASALYGMYETGKRAVALRKSIPTRKLEAGQDAPPVEGKTEVAPRNINGQRNSKYKTLTPEEIESLKVDIEALEADPSIFRFNEGYQTGYADKSGLIYVRGDVLPDLSSTHPRDLMSQRAVLAHEYYGHKYFGELYGEKNALPGAWNDEFRASYNAALNTPNLTDMDRMYLMADALERAKEAGVNIKITDAIRGVLYGR